ncbi:MAG: dihydrolipoamide acetyltransferase family protein [Bacteroidia bacterium]
MKVEVVMPKMGESIIEAKILRWLKKPGELVQADESLLEIATDKVDSEVPSPAQGVLAEIFFPEGATVSVGTVIATITSQENETTHPAPVLQETTNGTPTPSLPPTPPTAPPKIPAQVEGRFYSPLVRSIAAQEGISLAELQTVPGTGLGGRVTKKDLMTYLQQRQAPQTPTAPEAPLTSLPSLEAIVAYLQEHFILVPKKSFSHGTAAEKVPMDRMRKLIAENMVYSKHAAPHVTSFVEADVTALVLWREKVKKEFEKRYEQKLTYTHVFVYLLAQLLRQFPQLNCSVEGDMLIYKKEIHLGVAVALADNNLIVPVVRNADHLNLIGIATVVNDLTRRARENKLKPDEITGGTYTLTNVGTFGNVMGTPVILQPQVGILATGAIRKVPAIVETPTGDTIAIRHKMFLSHSYDHRIIDGALGGSFVRRMADLLEKWDLNTPI